MLTFAPEHHLLLSSLPPKVLNLAPKDSRVLLPFNISLNSLNAKPIVLEEALPKREEASLNFYIKGGLKGSELRKLKVHNTYLWSKKIHMS
ncbi:hypothetical protein DSO57_1027888 [Entomophthora muscae]|uniref:Uncharacterized protein n=1 Tax=Entomophthora muscae TaxID=34485 RepID=A0ACC2TCY5_9FUNG|nr:hypothetical protein DSO57_1027888 [Entomophthora muscae]